MNFPQSVITCLKKYLVFKGRASRSEWWYFFLFFMLVGFVGGFMIGMNPTNETVIYIIFAAFYIPALTVTVRRFHDFGVSGWMYFAFVVPLVISDFIIRDVQPLLSTILDLGTLLVFFVYVSKRPSKGKNKFGSVPKK